MDVKKMPKVDLHVHLDGGLQLDTVIKLAEKEGIELPAKNDTELKAWMQVDENCTSLLEYLKRFDRVNPLLQSQEALELAAFHLIRDAAKENIKYMEVRFAPTLHQKKGLKVKQVIEAVISGLQAGAEKYGVAVGGLISLIRDQGLALNQTVVETALPFYGKGIVGFDLAGNEKAYPASIYKSLFLDLKEKGIPFTIHAGEADGPDSVRTAVALGASRIGHGIAVVEDQCLMHDIVKERIILELCPTSNLQTKAVDDFSAYPLRLFLETGVLVTINTDNPSISNTTISQEWEKIQAQFALSEAEIKSMVLNGIQGAFVNGEEKRRLIAELEQDFSL
mgnify:FL=1